MAWETSGRKEKGIKYIYDTANSHTLFTWVTHLSPCCRRNVYVWKMRVRALVIIEIKWYPPRGYIIL